MLKELYLTIDIGTTAVKVGAFDEEFHMRCCENMEYELVTEGKRVTLSPDVYWKFIKEGIHTVTEKMGSDQFAGITVTSQGETLIPVNRQGVALYDAVIWLDGRADRQAEEINKIVSREEFYQKTGIPVCNEFCPVSKILWFMEEKPEIYEETEYFLLLEDYIIFRLTGSIVTEKSLLTTTGYFNLEEDRIWEELLHQTGISVDKIPKPLDCGELAGVLSKKAAEETGLIESTPVVTGAMDQVCGAIGAGNIAQGCITETTGTALCIGKTIYKKNVDTQLNVPVYRHYRKDLQLLLPVCMTAGMALKWFKDTLCEAEVRLAEETGGNVYDILSGMAEGSEPLAGGIVMLPYLAGSLQPLHAPEFRGGFLGIGLNSRKEDLIRALMEGVSYMLKENLMLLKQISKEEKHYIISMGGGAKSAVWNQIKADVTGMEIRVCKENETASAGAAMLCALGLKRYDSLEDMCGAVKWEMRWLPLEENYRKYKAGYKKYISLLEKLYKM